MAYLALYREWRPQAFGDVVGQEHITRTLQNAIKANRISHAYLFCGPRGTGKTTSAKILAKALNCLQGSGEEPCNICENCKRITEGNSMDVMEIDAASNRGIDEIRDLREKVKYSPTEGKYRIYIIDEVHMLTTEAFNALLKTLEEPPRHVIFVLATTEPHKIPTTILSRCQRFDFKRIGVDDIAARLRDVCGHMEIKTDEETLNLLAKTAEGGLRDALSVLDQCISFGGNRVSVQEVSAVLGTVNQEFLFRLTDCIESRDTTGALFLINEAVNQGKDLRQLSKDLTEHLRNLLLLKVSDKAGELIAVTKNTLDLLKEQAQKVERSTIMRGINIFSSAEREIKWSNQPRMVVEMAMIEACSPPAEHDVNELLARIQKLETMVQEASSLKPLEKVYQKPAPAQRSEAGKKSVADIKTECSQRGTGGQQAETARGTKDELTHVEQSVDCSLGEIQKKWPEVMEKVKRLKRTAHAFLIEGKPAQLKDNNLSVVFPDEYGFHKENIEKQENRETIEVVLRELFSNKLKVKCKFSSELEAELRDLGGDFPGESDEKDPLVEKAVELFGEKVIEFND